MIRRALLSTAAIVSLSIPLLGQAPASSPAWTPPPDRLTLPLWPGTAPGEPANMPPEIDMNAAKTMTMAGRPYIRLGNVSTPTLTLYKPAINPSGAAVLVFPGGGYQILAIDLEGTEVCDWLNSIGVTCVLVKYRVPDSGPYPKSPLALEDAQRALGLVR